MGGIKLSNYMGKMGVEAAQRTVSRFDSFQFMFIILVLCAGLNFSSPIFQFFFSLFYFIDLKLRFVALFTEFMMLNLLYIQIICMFKIVLIGFEQFIGHFA